MDRTVVIKLIQESFTKDAYGVQIPTETTHEVYAKVESVTLSEWSEGGRHGLNPELRFIMFAPDYHRERIIEYNASSSQSSLGLSHIPSNQIPPILP